MNYDRAVYKNKESLDRAIQKYKECTAPINNGEFTIFTNENIRQGAKVKNGGCEGGYLKDFFARFISNWLSLGLISFKFLPIKINSYLDLLNSGIVYQMEINPNASFVEFNNHIIKYISEKIKPIIDKYIKWEYQNQLQKKDPIFKKRKDEKRDSSNELIFEEWLYPTEDVFYYSFFIGYIKQHEKESDFKNFIASLPKPDKEKAYIEKYWKIKDMPYNQILMDLALKFLYGDELVIFLKNINFQEFNNTLININIQDQSIETSQKNNLIECQVYNFRNFIKAFFSPKIRYIQIPIYQRQYVWNNLTFEYLLKDINNLLLNNESNENYHYIGGLISYNFSYNKKIVVLERDILNHSFIEKEQEILKDVTKLIDGQQRVISLLLIWRAIFTYASLNNFEVDSFTYDFFKLNYINSTYFNKAEQLVEYSGQNQYFAIFKKIMLGDYKSILDSENAKYYTSTSIYKNHFIALNYFKENNFTAEKTKRFITALLDKIEFTQTSFIKTDEFSLFQNLNSNNVPLSDYDLIKNFIFMNIENNITKEHEKEIIDIFYNGIESYFTKNDKMYDKMKFFYKVFVKLFYLENYNKTYIELNSDTNVFLNFKNMFFKKYNNQSLNFEQYKELIREIEKKLLLFNLLEDPYKITNENYDKLKRYYPIFEDQKNEIRDIIKILARDVYYVPIMTIVDFCSKYNNPEKPKLREFMFALEKYAMFIKLTSNRYQSLTTFLDSFTNKFVKKINDNPNNFYEITSSDLLELLHVGDNDNSWKENEFFDAIDNLKKINLKDPIAKNLCTRIEFYLNSKFTWKLNKKRQIHEPQLIDKASLEHILPQSIAREDSNVKKNIKWINELKKEEHQNEKDVIHEAKKFINLIGNFLLVNNEKNSSLNAKSFQDKKQSYKEMISIKLYEYDNDEEGYPKLKSIEKFNKWDFESIQERTNQLVEIIKHMYSKYE
ncbi:DUF262 domain-containing protein [Candidatus Mycoplasma pogonae]